ncbi:hypothetical protein BDV11DRAFT_170152 [Aspergillus similis]
MRSLAISPLELDQTLQQLYARDKANTQDVHLVYALPTARVQMTRGMPLSTKFAYQDPLLHNDRATSARIFTQVLPHPFGLIGGKTNLIMFDLDDATTVDGQSRQDTEQVLSQLPENQRPSVVYVKEASEITLPPNAVIAMANPMDLAEHLPVAVPLESHYRGLSKRELALSGLPTPPSVVADTALNPQTVTDATLRAKEVQRMLHLVKDQPIPFVVKLPQGLSGQGTFLVNEEDRDRALTVLAEAVDSMLQLNGSNAHLNPASLIVQEMCPGTSVAVALFLTKDGHATISSCCSQRIDSKGHWDGASIDFTQQDRLKAEYAGLVEKLAVYMHDLGYYGPLGIDVMTSDTGEQWIIDLNTRPTGSHPLGYMTNHLYYRRGFKHAAIYFPVYLRLSITDFHEKFRTELEAGRIIVAGWSHELGNRSSVTTLIIAGEDEMAIDKVASRVEAWKSAHR